MAVLVYMAYLRKIGIQEAQQIKLDLKDAASETKQHLEMAAQTIKIKADEVHDLVNGKNEEFKRLLVEKTERDAELHRDIAEAAAIKATVELRKEFSTRMERLEQVIASQQKTIAGPIIESPEERLSEIRGEPK